jgi:hypothetical protein
VRLNAQWRESGKVEKVCSQSCMRTVLSLVNHACVRTLTCAEPAGGYACMASMAHSAASDKSQRCPPDLPHCAHGDISDAHHVDRRGHTHVWCGSARREKHCRLHVHQLASRGGQRATWSSGRRVDRWRVGGQWLTCMGPQRWGVRIACLRSLRNKVHVACCVGMQLV